MVEMRNIRWGVAGCQWPVVGGQGERQVRRKPEFGIQDRAKCGMRDILSIGLVLDFARTYGVIGSEKQKN